MYSKWPWQGGLFLFAQGHFLYINVGDNVARHWGHLTGDISTNNDFPGGQVNDFEIIRIGMTHMTINQIP